jgi:RNA polymerase sigma factor (sigma-70 family)
MSRERRAHSFRTTRWCLVVSAGRDSEEGATALSELCEIYWGPAHAFVRRNGYPAEDARDLTQAFFARVLEKGYFRNARPDRGRFRSYLLACLRHFLSNARDSELALKRGGAHVHISLECDSGERPYQVDPSDSLTPEHIYERRWAMAVIAQAMTSLEQKYQETARGALFATLKGSVSGDSVPYAELAAALDTTEGAVRVAVHRLRRDVGAALRRTIAETVGDPTEVDDELRYLLSVVGR